MKVILKEKVASLGKKGDVKEVAEGFARNFLFPKDLAFPATDGVVKMIGNATAREEASKKKKMEEVQALATRLIGHQVTIRLKIGEEGQAFGSASSKDIADALKREKFHIENEWIALEEPIKKTGGWNVTLKLPFGIETSVKVLVEKEESKGKKSKS